MAKYAFGGGLSGEANKVSFRKAQKFENGKAFSFKELNRNYVNFLSCVKSVTIKGTRVSKADLTFKLAPKLFVLQDKKTKLWSATDKIVKS